MLLNVVKFLPAGKQKFAKMEEILKNNSDKQFFLLSDGERVTVEADSEYEFR